MKNLILFSILLFGINGNAQDYKLENLGSNINSSEGDNNPVISPDGKTIYFWSTRYGARCFYSELDSLGNWGKAKPLDDPNLKEVRQVCAISPDGNTLLVNSRSEGRSFYSFSHKTKTGWSALEELKIDSYPEKTDDNYSIDASMSNDGTVIVFVMADVTNTFSKYRTDLMVTFLREDGTWTTPKNLGSLVNSYENSEISPFISSDKTTLFFSRNTSANTNDFDIYKTTRLDDTWENWSEPIALVSAVNDEKWNSGYTIPASGNYAFLVSSKNPLQGVYTDIVRIKLREEEKPNPVILIIGKVLDTKTNQPIDAKILYENLETGERIGAATTNPETGIYKVVLPYGISYGMTAIASNFISISENLDLKQIDGFKEIEKNIRMSPIEIGQTIRINNLFFETGKSIITKESFSELDRLVRLLNQNPSLKIQINGHTDNVGSLELNKKLSNERALAVKKYLTSKGIPETQLSAQGFGSSKPIAANDTEENKQLNRRVEFEIIAK